MRCAFVCVVHQSSIRPNGYDMAIQYTKTLKQFCNYPFKIYFMNNGSDPDTISSFENELNFCKNVDYSIINIKDQYISGLTGAWNKGIKLAAESKEFDLILFTNEDLTFNNTINNFIEEILLLDPQIRNNSLFGPLTNGIGNQYHWNEFKQKFGDHKLNEKYNNKNPQYSLGPRENLMKNITETTKMYDLNGFFIACTSDFYNRYRLKTGSLLSDSKEVFWGGQETELAVRIWKQGGKSFLIENSWINHIKLRQWIHAKEIQKSKFKVY